MVNVFTKCTNLYILNWLIVKLAHRFDVISLSNLEMKLEAYPLPDIGRAWGSTTCMRTLKYLIILAMRIYNEMHVGGGVPLSPEVLHLVDDKLYLQDAKRRPFALTG